MEKQVFDTKYLNIKISEKDKFISIRWKKESSQIKDDQTFKKEVLAFLSKMKEFSPVLVLNNLKEMNYPIAPELQSWYAQKMKENNVIPQKVAIILPSEMIAELSFKQTKDELGDKVKKQDNYSVKYFDNENKAKKWIFK